MLARVLLIGSFLTLSGCAAAPTEDVDTPCDPAAVWESDNELPSAHFAQGFDSPYGTKTISRCATLGGTRCLAYSKFVVKESTNGKKSEASIIPSKGGEDPGCSEGYQSDEVSVDKAYFVGAKGTYALFENSENGSGSDFSIYDASTGEELFAGTRVGAFANVQVIDSVFHADYPTSYFPHCSMLSKGKKADECWTKIKRNVGLTDAQKPNCSKAISDFALNLQKEGKSRKQIETLSSQFKKEVGSGNVVLTYPVRLTLSPKNQNVEVLPGAVECFPEP